jgi:alkane 1-monooxygenase
MRLLSYLFTLVIPISVHINLVKSGSFSFLALIVSYAVLPLLELMLPQPKENPKELGSSLSFDALLYLVTLYHFFLVVIYGATFSTELLWWEHLGRTLALGISCGVIGINVAHELGHRKERPHQITAFLLLATSLYTQFFIEHNKGHHRHVATLKDPATARLNESLYVFIVRSMMGTLRGAFKLDRQLFFLGMGLHLLLIGVFYFFVGPQAALGFIGAALFGAANLEAVNYIEHYGLLRNINPSGRPEKVQPHHSWNSNHYLGRKILFELTRHSDHHAHASRPYYDLRNFEEAPVLPTGYPGMMVLSLVPPLFFKVMNPRVEKWRANFSL